MNSERKAATGLAANTAAGANVAAGATVVTIAGAAPDADPLPDPLPEISDRFDLLILNSLRTYHLRILSPSPSQLLPKHLNFVTIFN